MVYMLSAYCLLSIFACLFGSLGRLVPINGGAYERSLSVLYHNGVSTIGRLIGRTLYISITMLYRFDSLNIYLGRTVAGHVKIR